ncbi:hypothetical protein [uncultured Imperialibacter sp.]|uniref:hypothetical protein n=1 Tax=uncultured Imperialibacter sp. TaxID=1672639 RepID=UPI0030D7C3FD|tara:strand:- start:25760 stop:26209 length:450 start_codon:yes stop_codon:yes gene_type:complete
MVPNVISSVELISRETAVNLALPNIAQKSTCFIVSGSRQLQKLSPGCSLINKKHSTFDMKLKQQIFSKAIRWFAIENLQVGQSGEPGVLAFNQPITTVSTFFFEFFRKNCPQSGSPINSSASEMCPAFRSASWHLDHQCTTNTTLTEDV